MGSLFARGAKLYAKTKTVDGRWVQLATGCGVGDESKARAWLDDLERQVAAERARGEAPADASMTVTRWFETWLPTREKLDLDWKNDRSRFLIHVAPVIGNRALATVRTRDIVELFARVRTNPDRPIAQRTVYNVYSVVAALFRDARLAGLIEQSPCILDERQLGPLRDKNPEWRAEAVFARAEVETIISSPAIPPDRTVVYALELLAGVRPGEGAALRWRHYDPTTRPLGKLLVAHAYNTRKHRSKGTKTEVTKHVPVHATLAAILAEWKLSGWAEMMGRAPEPDDLIVPLPPRAAARRRSRSGEAFRGHDYSGKRWREEDLPALGWRHRRHYDMRATFITLALEDGADPNVIETRVTHTKKSRSAFDGYNRGRQWSIVCAEVAKLNVRRRSEPEVIQLAAVVGAVMVQPPKTPDVSNTKQWRRRESNPRPKMHQD